MPGPLIYNVKATFVQGQGTGSVQFQFNRLGRNWRDRVVIPALEQAHQRFAPVGTAGDSMHRGAGALTGGYRRGLVVDRQGSGKNRSGFRVKATSPHSEFVEFGRRGSLLPQTFSRVAWGGQIRRNQITGIRAGERETNPLTGRAVSFLRISTERVVRAASQ